LSRKNSSGSWIQVESEVSTSTDGATFTWSQLEDGEYMLEEVTAPAGYNKIETKYFKIEAVHNTKDTTTGLDKLTSLTATLTDENGVAIKDEQGNPITWTTKTDDGSVTTTIENYKGVVLPETGGTGVKVLYTVGAILVLGAAILLITRRRMSMN
jgi:LPXTG-motif cell wall-anchored protein